MTLEEQIEAIATRKAEEALAPVLKKIAILEKVVAKNGDQISTAKAKELTGISDNRTLRKLFTPTQNGPKGALTWSRVEIETWKAKKQLPKAEPLAA